ncbi:MAG: hypothetical protein GY806_07545 [Gammaproteobacteria bacterium]|nr:hypothetical protein [Gammaproteobacteria bacterium]
MSHAQVLSGPASTKRLLANLSLAIDEAMLGRKIVGLSEQIRRIEYLPEQASRVQFLKNEILNLEDQLSDVRGQVL